MGYQVGDLYLMRVEDEGTNKFTFTFFLDEAQRPSQLQAGKDVKGEHRNAGYFDERDMPSGRAHTYTLAGSGVLGVTTYGSEITYLVQNSPKDGYYVQCEVTVQLLNHDNVVNIEGYELISLDGERDIEWSDFWFHIEVKQGYRIKDYTNVQALTTEECFELDVLAMGKETEWQGYLQDLHMYHTLLKMLMATENVLPKID